MKLTEFRNSKWCRDASRPETAKRVSKQLPAWQKRVKNLGLVAKAGQLWDYFTGGKATGGDKLLVLGALIYLISPLDLVPDPIPVIGWLDDLGIATFVLQYLNGKLAKAEEEDEIPGTAEQLKLEGGSSETTDVTPTFEVFTKTLPYGLAEFRLAAEELGSAELAESAADLEQEWGETLHQVLFVGRFNVGKSTLLNALIGQPLLAVGPVPTTRAITFVMSGHAPTLTSEDAYGVITQHDSIAELRDKEHPVLKGARRVLLTLPEKLLGGRACLVDSPGLEDPDPEFSALTLESTPSADAIVMVLDATVLLSAQELEFLKSLLAADREQKLFLVINKADRLSPAKLANTRNAAEDQLRKLGVTPRFFPLSAEAACKAIFDGRTADIPRDFVEFRDTLTAFLEGGIHRERGRYLQGRLSALGQNLLALCDANTSLAAQDEQTRAATLAADAKRRTAAKDDAEARHRKLDELLGRCENRCNAKFQVFFDDMESGLFQHIEKLSLSDLRKTDALALDIHNKAKEFIEVELKAVNEELSVATSEAMYELQTSLHTLRIKFDPIAQTSMVKPELIPTAIVVLSFPFLGMFSWIYLTVGTLFGRSAIEKLFGGILDRFGAGRLREELRNQLTPRMKEFKEKVEKTLADHFEELRQVTRHQLDTATTQALGAPVSPFLPGDTTQKDRAQQWRKRLIPLCSTNSPS